MTAARWLTEDRLTDDFVGASSDADGAGRCVRAPPLSAAAALEAGRASRCVLGAIASMPPCFGEAFGGDDCAAAAPLNLPSEIAVGRGGAPCCALPPLPPLLADDARAGFACGCS